MVGWTTCNNLATVSEARTTSTSVASTRGYFRMLIHFRCIWLRGVKEKLGCLDMQQRDVERRLRGYE